MEKSWRTKMTRLIRKSDALKFVPRGRTNLNDWHLNLCRHLTLSKDSPPKRNVRRVILFFGLKMSIYLFNERDSLFHSLCSYMAVIKLCQPLFCHSPPVSLYTWKRLLTGYLNFDHKPCFRHLVASSFHSMVAACSFRKRKVADSILVGGFPSQMLASVDNLCPQEPTLHCILFFFHLMVFIGEKFNLKIQGTLFFLELLNHKYHWKWCILIKFWLGGICFIFLELLNHKYHWK